MLRDDAIEFWQSLKITNQTTLAQVLRYFRKEYAKEDLKEMAKYKFDQMRYDPATETFNHFLNKFKKIAKQALGDRSSDKPETFLFAKLPVNTHTELARAGKHDATMEEIRTFVQRRCQYAQLLPNTTNAQPFNQMSAPQPNAATPQTSTAQPQQKKETKKSSTGNAITAAYMDISGWNAGNGCERKHKLNLRARHHSNQPKLPGTQTKDTNTTQNSCVKFVERWDTLPETVTTGTQPRQLTKKFRVPNCQQKKTNNSEGTKQLQGPQHQ